MLFIATMFERYYANKPGWVGDTRHDQAEYEDDDSDDDDDDTVRLFLTVTNAVTCVNLHRGNRTHYKNITQRSLL